MGAGFFDRLGPARGGKWRGWRSGGRVFALDVFLLIELTRHFARHLHDETGRVEAGDSSHPAFAILCGFPEALSADSIRADSTDSSDHCATHLFNFAFGPIVSIG